MTRNSKKGGKDEDEPKNEQTESNKESISTGGQNTVDESRSSTRDSHGEPTEADLNKSQKSSYDNNKGRDSSGNAGGNSDIDSKSEQNNPRRNTGDRADNGTRNKLDRQDNQPDNSELSSTDQPNVNKSDTDKPTKSQPINKKSNRNNSNDNQLNKNNRNSSQPNRNTQSNKNNQSGKNTPNRNQSGKNTPNRNQPDKDNQSGKDTPNQNQPGKDTPNQSQPGKDTPNQNQLDKNELEGSTHTSHSKPNNIDQPDTPHNSTSTDSQVQQSNSNIQETDGANGHDNQFKKEDTERKLKDSNKGKNGSRYNDRESRAETTTTEDGTHNHKKGYERSNQPTAQTAQEENIQSETVGKESKLYADNTESYNSIRNKNQQGDSISYNMSSNHNLHAEGTNYGLIGVLITGVLTTTFAWWFIQNTTRPAQFAGYPPVALGGLVVIGSLIVAIANPSSENLPTVSGESMIDAMRPTTKVPGIAAISGYVIAGLGGWLLTSQSVPLLYPILMITFGIYLYATNISRVWKNTLTRYYLTTDTIYETYRGLRMDRTPVPYKTIEKSPVSRGYISRLLGYGTIEIQNRAGSSSPEVKIRHIQRWKETEQTIRKRYSIEKDRE